MRHPQGPTRTIVSIVFSIYFVGCCATNIISIRAHSGAIRMILWYQPVPSVPYVPSCAWVKACADSSGIIYPWFVHGVKRRSRESNFNYVHFLNLLTRLHYASTHQDSGPPLSRRIFSLYSLLDLWIPSIFFARFGVLWNIFVDFEESKWKPCTRYFLLASSDLHRNSSGLGTVNVYN